MKSKVIMLALVLACCGASQAQTIYLSDNFDIYGTDADVTGAGWGIVDTPEATEESTWTVTNPGSRNNPPTIDGTPSTGRFMISDSDAQSVSGPQDNGASHDLYTPTFSTVGGGVVWLHVDVSAQLNNNGECIFFVDVSADGGDSWTTVFQRVAPGRTASTFPPDNTNVGGYFGRLDVNLTPYAANKGEVKIRFRHYEPSWDWWIAIDNVQVDDLPPPAGGRTIVFSEDFSSKTLGSMLVDGLNTGTETWTTRDGEKGNRYEAGTVGRFDGHAVDRLMHPAPEGPNGEVEFAILDSDANPDPAEDEYLMTPLLNLTGETNVFLHFNDEIVVNASESVLLMQDSNGNGIPDRADTILATILDYAAGGLRDPGEENYYHERVVSVPEAAGLDNVFFAFRYQGGNDWWWAVDDVMVTAGQPVIALARDPSPGDGATFVSRSAVLRWMPGLTADRHDVYFGTDKDAVEAAGISDTTGIYRGRQTATSYPVPETLAWGQTYYWRIDEIGPAPANTVYEGDVWMFTAEPFAHPLPGSAITASASSNEAGKEAENTINGSGLDEDLHSIVTSEMWLSAGDGPQPTWIQYDFDGVYKLHEMWVWNYNGEGLLVAYGLKDVDIEYSTDGTSWAKLEGVPEFAKAPGAADYAHDNVVDFDGALVKYVKITARSNWSGGLVEQYGLSEVRFNYIPVWASEPNPGDGATNVGPDIVLSWRAGREAATHDVYLSTSRRDVVNGTVAAINVAEAQYDAGTLDLGETYYWKIVEANDAETPPSWAGDVWDFTVVEYFIVDDMESYGDAATPGQPGSRIFYTWRDGLGWSEPSVVSGNGSGSIIGYAQAPFDERSTVRSGGHAMPYEYNNGSSPYYSEATAAIADLQISPDWTRAGAKALTLWFYGRSDNVPDQMYVRLNGGAKVPYDGNPNDLTEESWHEWNIDLSLFGVNVGNVTEIGIGFGDGTGPGGSGFVLFDAIRLHPSRCVLSNRSADFAGIDFVEDCVVDSRELEAITENWLFATADPGGAGLVGWWKCDGDMQDSSGSGNHGTVVGDPIFVTGMVGSGALELSDEDYVTMDGVADDMTSGDMSMGAWVKFTNSDEEAILSINTSSGGNRILMEHIGGEIGMWESGYEALSGVTVDDGAWHHAMYTRSGSLGSLYIDGVLRDTHTASFSLTSDDLWSVGQEWDTDSLGELVRSEVFNGTVDDVRVYKRALTDAEVAHLLYLAGVKLPIDLHEDQKIDLKDYAALADVWLDAQLWP
ncbi:MAG: discoidin domain-containing protein [Phycisphaerales bacterium]|nr:MAG: discoidin domain-containing protein [Phycisphaerales bacterium]